VIFFLLSDVFTRSDFDEISLIFLITNLQFCIQLTPLYLFGRGEVYYYINQVLIPAGERYIRDTSLAPRGHRS